MLSGLPGETGCAFNGVVEVRAGGGACAYPARNSKLRIESAKSMELT
jgi:hypothetical protein